MTQRRRQGISALCLFITLVCWLGVLATPPPPRAHPGTPLRRTIEWEQMRKLLAGLGALAAVVALTMQPFAKHEPGH